MAMNMVRTGTSAVTGVASGVLASDMVAPLQLGGQVISWATIVESLALIGGLGMQFMSPYTAPNMADGLVDGGAALLAARATVWAMSQGAGGGAAAYALHMAQRANNPSRAMNAGRRAAIGGGSPVPKYQNA